MQTTKTMPAYIFIIWTFYVILHVFITKCHASSHNVTYYCRAGVIQEITNQTGFIVARYENTPSYDKNMDCKWILKTDAGYRWQLTTTSFDIEWAPDRSLCTIYDQLLVNEDGKQLVSSCYLNPYSIISNTSSGVLDIAFKSNALSLKPKRGVEITFNAFDTRLCPPSWHEKNAFCYKFSDHHASWATAQTHCGYDRSNLASLQNQAELTYVRGLQLSLGAGSVYIGLYDNTGENNFHNIDRTAYVNVGWSQYYPNIKDTKKCVAVESSTGMLRDYHCDEDKMEFVCKMNKGNYTEVYGSSPPLDNGPHKDAERGFLIWYVIAIIVGCVAVIAIIAVSVYCWLKYRQRTPQTARQPSPRRVVHPEDDRTFPSPDEGDNDSLRMPAVRHKAGVLPPLNSAGTRLNPTFDPSIPPQPPTYEESLREADSIT